MRHTNTRLVFAPGGMLLLLVLLVISLVPALQAQSDVRYFPETGHSIRGSFRTFWETNGGLPIFGYPITGEYIASSNGRVTQYFERARFELTEINGQPFVELGRLGIEFTGGRIFPKVPPIPDTPDRRYIYETQHIIQYGFKEIWETRGAERIFGFPISEEIKEVLDNGKWHTVQYFERARFEYWPERAPGDRVLLSNLGAMLVPPELRAPAPPSAPPAAPQPAPGGPGLPPNINANVIPDVGPPGTVFRFEATGFEPRERVGIWITAPDQATYDAGFQVEADNAGSIIDEGVGLVTNQDFGDGVWSFNAQGVSSGRQAVGYFRISRGALGAPGIPGLTSITLDLSRPATSTTLAPVK